MEGASPVLGLSLVARSTTSRCSQTRWSLNRFTPFGRELPVTVPPTPSYVIPQFSPFSLLLTGEPARLAFEEDSAFYGLSRRIFRPFFRRPRFHNQFRVTYSEKGIFWGDSPSEETRANKEPLRLPAWLLKNHFSSNNPFSRLLFTTFVHKVHPRPAQSQRFCKNLLEPSRLHRSHGS